MTDENEIKNEENLPKRVPEIVDNIKREERFEWIEELRPSRFEFMDIESAAEQPRVYLKPEKSLRLPFDFDYRRSNVIPDLGFGDLSEEVKRVFPGVTLRPTGETDEKET